MLYSNLVVNTSHLSSESLGITKYDIWQIIQMLSLFSLFWVPKSEIILRNSKLLSMKFYFLANTFSFTNCIQPEKC